MPDENDYCAVGSGWFIVYRVDSYCIYISVLAATDDMNKGVRALEMLSFFKAMLNRYRGRTFHAAMNKQSLKIYKSFLKRDLLHEIYQEKNEDEEFKDTYFVADSSSNIKK